MRRCCLVRYCSSLVLRLSPAFPYCPSCAMCCRCSAVPVQQYRNFFPLFATSGAVQRYLEACRSWWTLLNTYFCTPGSSSCMVPVDLPFLKVLFQNVRTCYTIAKANAIRNIHLIHHSAKPLLLFDLFVVFCSFIP